MISGMFSTMHHHTAPLGESLPAEIADVRPFSRVRQFVHSERSGPGESFRANFTHVRPLARVPPVVHLQALISREFVAAKGTEEHLRVYGEMSTQSLLAREFLAANVALIDFSRSLQNLVNRPSMGHQVGLLQISVATDLADERLLAQVAGLVILQLAVGHVTFITLVAMVAEVTLMDPSIVRSHGKLVVRGETAYLALVLDATVKLFVIRQFRGTFERLVAKRARIRA